MKRWIAVAAMVGLVAGGAGGPVSAEAQAGVELAIWREAGIVPFPRSLEAPRLKLRDLSGALVDLSHVRGRLVMLYFWTSS